MTGDASVADASGFPAVINISLSLLDGSLMELHGRRHSDVAPLCFPFYEAHFIAL